MRKPTETDLVRACLQLLAHHRIPAWRANAGGGLRRGRGGRTVPVRANPEGTPDVLAILPPAGRLCGIECKMPGGPLRAAQLAWAEAAHAAGALCLTVYDVKDLEAALRREGVIR